MGAEYQDILHLAVVNFAPVWGDKAANLRRILEYIDAAAQKGAGDVSP